MNINVRYNGPTYGTGNSPADSYIIELSLDKAQGRPKDAPFPDNSDMVCIEYKFNPAVIPSDTHDREAQVVGASLRMSFEEAEALAQLLRDSLQHAKDTKAPVAGSVTQTKATDAPGVTTGASLRILHALDDRPGIVHAKGVKSESWTIKKLRKGDYGERD